jgi:hypothetical protein
MTFTIALIAIAAFLSGSAIGILAILAAGIRSGDRAKNLTSTPRTGTEAVTRQLLGVGVRIATVDHGGDHELGPAHAARPPIAPIPPQGDLT